MKDRDRTPKCEWSIVQRWMRYQIKGYFKYGIVELKLNFKGEILKLRKIREIRTCADAHGALLSKNVTFQRDRR